jgi:hypothetical protein
MGRADLGTPITKHGGSNYFRKLLGEEIIQVSAGFWTEEKTFEELKKVKEKIGHFPTKPELSVMGRGDLLNAMTRNGGINKFRELLGEEIIKAVNGFWTEEKTLEELKKVKEKIGHFPTQTELSTLGRMDLQGAITKYGGSNKFRELLGEELLRVPDGFWTEEKILKGLKTVKNEIGHFPVQKELSAMGRADLSVAISRHGGSNKFRELLGEELLQAPAGFWTEEKTLEELKKVTTEIGHFPKHEELSTMGRADLEGAITKHGGSNYFRNLLGVELLQVSAGHWTIEQTLEDLKKITDDIGHFPSHNELSAGGRGDLLHAISRNGGVDKFREMLGYPPSLEEYSGLGAYVSRRGYKSEKEVKKILLQYCKQNGRPEPTYNIKLSIGNVIEFVCGGKIGIDVTNTKDYSGWKIRRKYHEKDYNKYLDKLWIVVLSDVFTNEDYIRFNEESPKNVEIMSVWDLIDTLQVDIDEHSKRKLEALETCTLRTKDDLINMLKNRTLGEFI